MPGKYRTSQDSSPERYSFRVGACLLSLAFLAVGVGVVGSFVSTGDYWQIGLGILFCAIFAASGLASHFWSDRPVSGLRRLLADSPFIVVGIAGIAVIGAMAYGIALVLIQQVKATPLLMIAIVPGLALLVLVMHRTSVLDLKVHLNRRFSVDYASSLFPRHDTLRR
jgi:hypothetical protein